MKARKSLLAPSLGTPFWPQGRFCSIFWSRPGPKNELKGEKNTRVASTFFASKKQTREFERRSGPGSHFETLLGGSREHSGLHFCDFCHFFVAVSQTFLRTILAKNLAKKPVHHRSISFAGPPTSGAAVSRQRPQSAAPVAGVC